jgi:hypothetical protein
MSAKIDAQIAELDHKRADLVRQKNQLKVDEFKKRLTPLVAYEIWVGEYPRSPGDPSEGNTYYLYASKAEAGCDSGRVSLNKFLVREDELLHFYSNYV